MSFKTDLENSNIQVNELVKKLGNVFGGEIEIFDIKEYDIKLTQKMKIGNFNFEKVLTFEIKDERKLAGKTGNHFLEISSRDQVSGILTTTADYWLVQFTDDLIVFLAVSEMKKMIKTEYRKIKGGDMNTSTGILVPINDILQNNKCLVLYGPKFNTTNLPIS